MRDITFTHRTINHSVNGHNNKSSLKSSLDHDLRLANTESQKLSHDHEMTSNNMIFHHGKAYRMTEHNSKVMSRMIMNLTDIPELKPDSSRDAAQVDIKKQQNLASAIRTKFKKYKVPDNLAHDFMILADPETTIDDVRSIREKLDSESMDRKKTKLDQIDKYIQLRIEMDSVSKPKPRRGLDLSTCVQSQIYKIPNQHNVTHEEVSITDYASFIQSFHKKFFPDHELMCVVGHVDERSVDDSTPGTGDHCHAYVSGRNKVTGKYDLIAKQIEVAEKILSIKNPELLQLERDLLEVDKSELESRKELFPESKGFYDRKIEKLNGRYYGRIWQECIRISANEMLLNKKQLNAEFHYNTRGNKSILIDQSLPINKRKYSRAAQQVELLNKQKESIKDELKELEQNRNRIEVASKQINNQILVGKQIASELDLEIESKGNILDTLTNKLNDLAQNAKDLITRKIQEQMFIGLTGKAIKELSMVSSPASKQFQKTCVSVSEKIDKEINTNVASSIKRMKF